MMSGGDKLAGMVAQSMSGARAPVNPVSYAYPAGSFTFTTPTGGWYRFVLRGAGGGANNGTSSGASGALVIAERALSLGQRVTIAVGSGGATSGGNGGDTTATFPSGEVLTAQGGQGATGGTATANAQRGDTAVNGTNGTLSGGNAAGASAPTSGAYTGASGAASGGSAPGGSPGAGGCTNSASGTYGGDGSMLVLQVRLQP